MSFDSPSLNQQFAQQEMFQYELWSDTNKELALYYGSVSSPSAGSAGRVTRLIGADGSLLLEYGSFSVSVHAADVLADCQALFGP